MLKVYKLRCPSLNDSWTFASPKMHYLPICLYFSPPGMYANDTSLTLVGVDQSIVYDYLTYVTV